LSIDPERVHLFTAGGASLLRDGRVV
jgi:hypothetical protein